MGNESSGHGLHSFSAQRLHGTDLDNIYELPKPDSELERSKGVLENILRWEDDGARVFETNKPLPQLAVNKKPRLIDKAGASD